MEWKSLLPTFVCIIFGFALALFVVEKRGHGFHAGHLPRSAHFKESKHKKRKHHKGKGESRFFKSFVEEYDLSEEDQRKAKKIFSEQRKKMKELRDKVFPEFQKIREQTHAEIRLLIPDEKKQAFDEKHKKMESKRMKMFPKRHHKRRKSGKERRTDHGHRSYHLPSF